MSWIQDHKRDGGGTQYIRVHWGARARPLSLSGLFPSPFVPHPMHNTLGSFDGCARVYSGMMPTAIMIIDDID